MVGGSIFAIGLVGHDFVVGDGVGAGATDLAEKEPLESRLAFDHVILLMIHVEEVKLAGSFRKNMGKTREQAAHYGGAEGIEEKKQAWSRGKSRVYTVAADYPHGRARTVCRFPFVDIPAGHLCQERVEFDSDDFAKWVFRRQQHGASHACTHIHEREELDGRHGVGPLPSHEECLKHRWSDAEVCGRMAVVGVAGFEIASGDKAAGFDVVFRIEGVRGVSLFPGHARKPG